MPEALALVLATHLARCADCQGTLATIEAVGGALLDELPPAPLALAHWTRMRWTGCSTARWSQFRCRRSYIRSCPRRSIAWRWDAGGRSRSACVFGRCGLLVRLGAG